jgi:glycosyltransferase involved in cell wall biosynthesis
MTVAGDGPSLAELKERLRTTAGRVVFTGAIQQAEVPALLAQHDVLLMPSRYEGFGLVLIEAMAAGCVPVASRIQGVTDAVVEHGRTGFLFPVGAVGTAAALVRRLCDQRATVTAMALSAREDAKKRFALDTVAASYADLLQTCGSASVAAALPIAKWSYPRQLTGGIRSHLPQSFKNALLTLREAWRGSFCAQPKWDLHRRR